MKRIMIGMVILVLAGALYAADIPGVVVTNLYWFRSQSPSVMNTVSPGQDIVLDGTVWKDVVTNNFVGNAESLVAISSTVKVAYMTIGRTITNLPAAQVSCTNSEGPYAGVTNRVTISFAMPSNAVQAQMQLSLVGTNLTGASRVKYYPIMPLTIQDVL